MRITMVGTGYVGLVTGTCFADLGNQVTCVDVDQAKVEQLEQGKIPIYEPGLAEMVQRNSDAGRLHFTTSLTEAVVQSDMVFLAVGTPSGADGAADLSALWQVTEALVDCLPPSAIVVVKSTVPVGTNTAVYQKLRERTGRECAVASNPEFLKEGAAINDFMYPDRVVVGVRESETELKLRHLYAPLLRTDKPFLAMSPESAEMTKYVANALLSTKISFINEMANLCQQVGGDIDDVRRGIGHDRRIGFAFLFPGAGYGGSCFPKDVRALGKVARDHGIEPLVLDAVDEVNNRQKSVLANNLLARLGDSLEDKRIAVWGLSFKPQTDDIREAPALVLIDRLLEAGATVQVHDPAALENVRARYGNRLVYAHLPLDVLEDADALVIVTEWAEFRHPDLEEMKRRMRQPLIFDGRNLYDLGVMEEHGFEYHSIGRPVVGKPAMP